MEQGLKLTVSQKQTQKLALTQQMQQAIAILQKNQEELAAFIMDKANENPLLEVSTSLAPVTNDYRPTNGSNARSFEVGMVPTPDHYTSLFEYLLDQVHLNYRDTPIRKMMLFLVEFMDENGYLTISLAEAATKAGVTDIIALDALTLIQQLDPAGIGARNLQECLLLQIERDPEAPPLAYIVVEEHFENLADRHWLEIAQHYQVDLAEIQKIMDYIQTLSPAPGAHFGQIDDQFIIPELEVTQEDGQLTLQYLQTGLPKLKFQSNYFEKMTATGDPEVLAYLTNKKKEYDWLTKTLEQRRNTIAEVGRAIVLAQQDFFIKNEHPLKPLTLKQIANTVGIHESTVSRAVNGKYLKTNFGIFELRTFFVSAIAGQSTSNQEIKKRLIEIIQGENKQKPFSDQKLSELLSAEDIEISRRTVAKYRESLGIPSTSKRKRFY